MPTTRLDTGSAEGFPVSVPKDSRLRCAARRLSGQRTAGTALLGGCCGAVSVRCLRAGGSVRVPGSLGAC